MSEHAIPEGWAYDAGDTSVGIWPCWVHEACEAEYERGVDHGCVGTGVIYENGMAPFRYVLECRDCGQFARFTHDEYVGVDA